MASGFECDFLDSENAAGFECPLCLHVTRRPSLTSCCGQHFCEACVGRVVSANKPCPFCKAAPGFKVMFDKKQERRVLELKVQCSMKERGCSWVGELRDLQAHVSPQGDCVYADVVCSNGCDMKVPKCMLTNHLRDSCPKRKSTCEYCGFSSTYEGLVTHFQYCPKFPLPCPNKCSEGGSLIRFTLDQHLLVCPLNPVACKFSHAGCNTMIARKDLASHMEQSVNKHLNLVMKFASKSIHQLRLQLENKDTEIQELKEKIQRLELSTFPLPLPPIEFVMPHFSQHGLGSAFDSPAFLTHPMGNKIKVKILVMKSNVSGFILRLPGPFDSERETTIKCSVVVKMLNQTGDHDHIEHKNILDFRQMFDRSKEEVPLGFFQVSDCASINEPKKGNVQYVKDNCLRFQVTVNIID